MSASINTQTSNTVISTPVNDYACQLLEHEALGPGLYRMRLKPMAQVGFRCLAGQFVMLDLPTPAFFFRRPFSVLAMHNDGSFEILYKVVGQGTRQMAELAVGQTLNILGPLGKGFPLPEAENPKGTLLIGGGIGIAPLYLYALQAQQAFAQTFATSPLRCVYGVRQVAEVGLKSQMDTCFGPESWALTTDDGSAGFQGNVCQFLQAHPEWLKDVEQVFLCGPTPMMAACVKLLNDLNPHLFNSNLAVYASLEEHMPCGTGACTACVVARSDRLLPSKTCTEGPVFDARLLVWPTDKKHPPFLETASCSR